MRENDLSVVEKASTQTCYTFQRVTEKFFDARSNVLGLETKATDFICFPATVSGEAARFLALGTDFFVSKPAISSLTDMLWGESSVGHVVDSQEGSLFHFLCCSLRAHGVEPDKDLLVKDVTACAKVSDDGMVPFPDFPERHRPTFFYNMAFAAMRNDIWSLAKQPFPKKMVAQNSNLIFQAVVVASCCSAAVAVHNSLDNFVFRDRQASQKLAQKFMFVSAFHAVMSKPVTQRELQAHSVYNQTEPMPRRYGQKPFGPVFSRA